MAAQQAVLVSFTVTTLLKGLMGWTIGTTIGQGFARGRLQPFAAPGRLGLRMTLTAR